MTWLIYKKAPPYQRRGLGWIVYMSGTAASLSQTYDLAYIQKKAKS